MLTISSSSTPAALRRPVLRRRHSQSLDLYRPRTITIEKTTTSASYGFSIQTYGFASLNPLSTDDSACSLVSLSSGSTLSRKSSASNSFCLSSSQIAPIQLVTYVDNVQEQSPAWDAGLRAGSVILSVNDETVEHDDHETLVRRITQASMTQLKLVIIQQNINKQIALCEQLQQLHKQLQEKEEELEELCKQEKNRNENIPVKETESPSPRLQHISEDSPEHSSSFCHNKIPLDWRQSVTTFAHQQKLTQRVLPPVLTASASVSSSKYLKNRKLNPTQNHGRSLSLSTLVLQYSKPSILRHHSSIKHQRKSNNRRALSHEEIFYPNNNRLARRGEDDSILASGCSLAMDLSKSFDKNNHHLSSSSSSSTSTVNSDDYGNNPEDKLDNHIKQFKWKLKISK
ncbi:unnamed protein product [Adineta steineri]|uniref:PDZ domain-containing protein n=1 Tax=Adineta steineri TaxID=433720 RepID=A0A814STI5_9BILA|nr:unnamed protein product [Adineta steineri]